MIMLEWYWGIPVAGIVVSIILVIKKVTQLRRTPLMELASVLKTGETDEEVVKYKMSWEKKVSIQENESHVPFVHILVIS
jgi:hypothetical protein